MIGLVLQGRLGNQLFQYAFIYTAAQKLNTPYYIDTTYQEFVLPKYFSIKREPFYKLEQLLSRTSLSYRYRFYIKIKFHQAIAKLYRLSKIDFHNGLDVTDEMKRVANRLIYYGYFQSQAYFSAYEPVIRELFTIRKHYTDDFKKIFEILPAGFKYVAIHIRRGDYLDQDFCLPINYYHDAIKSIHSERNYYIIISDEPDLVQHDFAYLTNKYVSNHTEIIDLQLIMHSDVCILSNSSFSWWGAFLNKKQAKVIAPKYWFGKKQQQEIPRSIIPVSWVQLDYD